MKKIKIAFIKYAGLSSGGTEKFLQIIAANLSKKIFEVDFYYCDSTPYKGSDYKSLPTDQTRINYLLKHGVKLIKFDVKAKDITTVRHDWDDTNFFQIFDEKKYDIIQTGRAGHPEYPFYKIKNTPIVDSIHLSCFPDNQFNISRVLHLCNWSAKKWIKKGGDAKRVRIVSLPIEMNFKKLSDFRKKLNLKNKFVYGFHQRADDEIFSEIPLEAYKKIETDDTAFVLLNGSKKYLEQAKLLNLKNFVHIPFLKKQNDIYKFLRTLNVYAHGRKDGEVNSQAMAEAMFFGLPIVSHLTKINNGHVECIGNAGKVVNTIEEYAKELKLLKDDKNYYTFRSDEAKKRFKEKYELKNQMIKIENIYLDVIKNPFPYPMRRKIFSLTNIFYLISKKIVLILNNLLSGQK